jgi:hypothetical protein
MTTMSTSSLDQQSIQANLCVTISFNISCCTNLRSSIATRNVIKAAPLPEQNGNHVNWIITETMRLVTFNDFLHIFHDDIGNKELESADSDGDMDNNNRQAFHIGLLSEIHGFHGKYAIISLSEIGLEEEHYLYWIDTKFLEVPPYLASKAYQAHLLHPFFTLHI